MTALGTLAHAAPHVPTPTASRARAWLDRFAALAGKPPHVTWTDEGEIVFEWWTGAAMVTVYVSDTATHLVASNRPFRDVDPCETDDELRALVAMIQ